MQHTPKSPHTHEHALDVLDFSLTRAEAGERHALVVVVATIGGGVRSPGALMAVSENGDFAGYVSGGCIDADVVAQAQDAITKRQPRSIRYGEGSPFVDLKLPCGGGIDIQIIPQPDTALLLRWRDSLRHRQPAHIAVLSDRFVEVRPKSPPESALLTTTYFPKLRIRAAGRGADFWTFSNLVTACGYDLLQQTTDEDVHAALPPQIRDGIELLRLPERLRPCADDAWTAFVLVFHDADWEAPLLEQALAGPAFYIGAVGARRAQANRRNALTQRGVSDAAIDRIHAPIGLVPRARNASFLAVSSLAEIIAAFQEQYG